MTNQSEIKWDSHCTQFTISASASLTLVLDRVKKYIWFSSHCVFSWEAEYNTLCVIATLSTELMSRCNWERNIT